ncbi:MAG TPA: DUF6569 family protein [Bryobacteraceae bacterium]|nr:DUF6569 family protein [Bryobacteraceae bacterium]
MRTLYLSALVACGVLLAAPGTDDYRVSGPYTHDNLSIFLIHGKSDGKTYLTLREGLEQKKVVVYETKQVNELAIENLSDEDVFVQGGDIVKGGQQDRVLPTDFLLPAKSGRVPISSFCVEPGRWTRRGSEPAQNFSVSTETVVNADMAKAMKVKKNQGDVWSEVAKTQGALMATTVASSDARANPTHSFTPPSSLQLTLESKAVAKAVDGYLKALARAVDGKPDIVGFAFAVNGTINSADIYASSELFRAMWPKLLKSGAVEAVRSLQKDQKFEPPPATTVEAVLHAKDIAKTSTAKVGKITLVNGETGKQLVFESRDGEALIHRNYIAK